MNETPATLRAMAGASPGSFARLTWRGDLHAPASAWEDDRKRAYERIEADLLGVVGILNDAHAKEMPISWRLTLQEIEREGRKMLAALRSEEAQHE